MADLPNGIVTFLLTDIEGSTVLWERYPEAMRRAIARHDDLMTTIIEQHGGIVIRSRGEGDSFFAVFPRGGDAVAAACDSQRTLKAETWPTGTPIRVRMAVHTGEADLRDGDYYGLAVNRCARLRAVAHGGQILLSETATMLLPDARPPGAGLRDLGEHRLRDLTRPERIFQLLHPELPADFPALDTVDRRPNNLPAQATPLIGREREVAAARELLLRADVRLLMLTGAGGTGKTRLALQVAAEVVEHFADGVFFVPLAPIRDPSLVASAIVQALGIQEAARRTLADVLTDYLREKQLLLLLDNFEQVLGAAPLVGEILAACPRLKILVTSRAVLHLYGEHDFPVPPMMLPGHPSPPVERLTQFEAVRLFIARARAVQPSFAVTNDNAPAVAEICHRLDGLPLAIELAAAHSRFLPPESLLARLDRRLSVLIGGARDLPARQQTLRATIAWSYDLLDEDERILLRRLGVFVGGCTLETIETVCDETGRPAIGFLNSTESLLDKSLLQQEQPAGSPREPRLHMLETIREFALEQLEASGEAAEIRRRHAEHYRALVEEAEPKLHGPDLVAWLNRLDAEHDNIRAALAWSHTGGLDAETELRVAGALRWFWFMRGHVSEGRRWLEAGVAASGAAPASVRAKALVGAGHLAQYQGDYRRSVTLLEEGLAISRGLGDERGMAAALGLLGEVARFQGNYDHAVTLLDESLTLSQRAADRAGVYHALYRLAEVARSQGAYDRARTLHERSLTIRRELGDKRGIAASLVNLGGIAYQQGDYATARVLVEESLALKQELRDKRGIAVALSTLGQLATHDGQYAEATAMCRESLAIHWELGDSQDIAECFELLGGFARARGEAERAVRLFVSAELLRDAIGAQMPSAARAVHEQELASARAQLPVETFEAARSEAQAMPLAEVVTYALETPTSACKLSTGRREPQGWPPLNPKHPIAPTDPRAPQSLYETFNRVGPSWEMS